MTVYDLEELELAYAPPYGSAKDPVNYAGFVAANVLRGDMGVSYAEEMISPREDQVLLDVRDASEVAAGTIPGARNIPLGELRARLASCPRTKRSSSSARSACAAISPAASSRSTASRARNLTGG